MVDGWKSKSGRVDRVVGVEEKKRVCMDAEEWVDCWYGCQRALELSDDGRVRRGG
jgi:hypothetical protein